MPKFVAAGGGLAMVALGTTSSCARRRCAIAVLGTMSVIFAVIFPTRAAEAYSADAVKAEFLYRFAGYVEWPADLRGDASFIIAVVGADGVFNELKRLVPGRSVQSRPVVISKVSAIAELEHVQILYIPAGAQGRARALLAAATSRPILIVTDEAGGLARGSIVNFIQLDRHVRFEISLTAAERSKLKINSGLLSVAAYVEGVRPRADIACWRTPTFSFAAACSRRPRLADNAKDAGMRSRSGPHRTVRDS